jgi:hypothetical protein
MYTSISLFSLATSGALSMHSFSSAYNIFYLALALVVFSMSFWFRDIISEGTGTLRLIQYILNFFYLNTAKALPIEDIKQALSTYISNLHLNPRGGSFLYKKDKNSLGYYLAGLLEGDGSISIPGLGTTTMNRILNPRIVFTTHINNIGMYSKWGLIIIYNLVKSYTDLVPWNAKSKITCEKFSTLETSTYLSIIKRKDIQIDNLTPDR